MRASLEKYRTAASPLKRLLYWTFWLAGRIVPLGFRTRMWVRYCQLTKWTPKWYRVATAIGLNEFPREKRIIVSLTSYPKRIGSVHRTINTLLTQSFKPDKVILWLGIEQFPNREKDLPPKIIAQKQFGLTIEWCEDLRSYKKLIPALKIYPDDIIVTADDDVFYWSTWLEELYDSYCRDPQCVSCHLCAKFRMKAGQALSYVDWPWSKDRGMKCYRHHLIGVSGVLYPPHSLHSDVLNEEKFKSLSPQADDLWFWSMAILKGTKIKVAERARCDVSLDHYADTTEALNNTNSGELCLNDVQFRKILNEYQEVKEKLWSTNR